MIQDYSIDTAIMGDLFKMNFTKTWSYDDTTLNDEWTKPFEKEHLKSKTQLKREADDVQALGVEIAQLSKQKIS